MNPTQRSLKWLRENGYLADKTEWFNTFAKKRRDLFGFIDIVSLKGAETSGIQVTTTGNLSARRHKIVNLATYRAWKEAGNKVVLHGWSKKGKVGKRKTWQVTIREI